MKQGLGLLSRGAVLAAEPKHDGRSTGCVQPVHGRRWRHLPWRRCNYTSAGLGNPFAGTNASTDYVLSGGAICVTASNVPVSCSHPDALAKPVDHNLGADNAAYAVLFPELNAQLAALFGNQTDAALSNFTLHIDVRLGCAPSLTGDTALSVCDGNPYGRSLNNGYEQIFLATAGVGATCSTTDPDCGNTVPEPGTLAMVGMALGALVLRQRRNQRR